MVRFLLGAALVLAACGEKSAVRSPHGAPIELAALKVTPAKGSARSIELKEDGAVLVDGRPSGRIRGDHVEAADGTPIATVSAKGLLVGSRIGPGFRFVGDDLVTDAGAKLFVDEGGAIVVAKDRGTEVLARIEGGVAAKRAALALGALWLTLPMYVTTDTSKADMPASAPEEGME